MFTFDVKYVDQDFDVLEYGVLLAAHKVFHQTILPGGGEQLKREALLCYPGQSQRFKVKLPMNLNFDSETPTVNPMFIVSLAKAQ